MLKKIFGLLKKSQNIIVVVSGLPRSGTSMMMKMLAAGGLRPFTDNIRQADDDNLKGYYEFERVKQLETDKAWLPEAKGKVVKIISALLRHLPPEYVYKIIFMQRDIQEILASQRQMLIRRGKYDPNVSDDELANKFRLHLEHVGDWISRQSNIDVIYLNYNEILQNKRKQCIEINEFLGKKLDVEKMAKEIDYSLYRQRR